MGNTFESRSSKLESARLRGSALCLRQGVGIDLVGWQRTERYFQAGCLFDGRLHTKLG
jgi:hypothetical protein